VDNAAACAGDTVDYWRVGCSLSLDGNRFVVAGLDELLDAGVGRVEDSDIVCFGFDLNFDESF